MNLRERYLLNRIRKRNRKAFQQLFEQEYATLVTFANSYTADLPVAEDLVQGVFVYLWEHANILQINTSLRSYLFAIVKNRGLNYLKHLKVQDKHHLLYAQGLMVTVAPDDEEYERKAEIIEALELLPKRMGEIFKLKYLEGKKHHEIATLLGISENTIKKQLQRGKEKLANSISPSAIIFFIFSFF